jgi:hypothetical protein
MPRIRVHERALAHLSRGLYRSPASALRELVSNAWDANATRVSIDTNYPNFFQLSIEDNGDGFSRDEFESLMSGGIGNSQKRTDEEPLKYGRPTIGRLGIGMLGIAQICGAFIVTSKPKSGKAFKARVNLYDLAKAKMDEKKSELVHDATTTTDTGEKIAGKIVDVGTYEFIDVGDDPIERGTRILVDDVTPVFTLAFKESLTLEEYKAVPREWKKAVTGVLNKSSSLQVLGDYWRLLWELSAACPIPYLAGDALPRGVVKEKNNVLESYNFSLYVDGRQLFKPILLRGNPGGYTTTIIHPTTEKVYGNNLKLSGYIVVQEGLQLKPDELRGIMIRIKNVGIGYYDQSMLDYRSNEGPRSRWLTGEIYVDEGLEDALNVDRDSFNRFHPEFRALQNKIHSILRTNIFPAVYKNIDVRSEERKSKIASKRDRVVKSVVQEHESRSVRIVRKSVAPDNDDDKTYSSARRNRDAVEVVVPKTDDIPTGKSSRQLAQALLTLFELALLEPDKEAQRQKFSELLFDLLKRW